MSPLFIMLFCSFVSESFVCRSFPYKLKLTGSSGEVYHGSEEATAATIIIANLIVIGEYVLGLL